MAMLPAEKQKIIDEYKTHDTDTGSSEVQIITFDNPYQTID